MSRTYTTWPLRFSPNPAAMIDFFAALGLRQTLGHEDQTYATFAGTTGSLGVHSAEKTEAGAVPGHTALNLATDDLPAAADELRAAGLEVSVWDETYGKQGTVTAATGLVIGLNQETQEDLYGGYEIPDRDVVSSLGVVVVCTSDDVARDTVFFAGFGYAAVDSVESGSVRLEAGEGSGVLVLRPGPALATDAIRGDQLGPPYVVSLGFETSEPLDPLAARLTEVGHRAEAIDDVAGPYVSVIDPDGETLRVDLTR